MRKVLPMSRIREMEPYMDAKVLDYIHEGQIEAFEGFEDFDLIAFDWYDVRSERTAASQMLLYLDREDLFVFCEDDAAEDAAQAALLVPEEEALSNEQVLHRFFVRLLRGDMAHLARVTAWTYHLSGIWGVMMRTSTPRLAAAVKAMTVSLSMIR